MDDRLADRHPDLTPVKPSRIAVVLECRAGGADVKTLGYWMSKNSRPFYEFYGYEPVTTHRHEFSIAAEIGVTGTVLEM